MATMSETDDYPSIDQTEMNSFQMTAVAICLVLNMLDGFDVLVIAFTAPEISAEWGLRPEQLGILFSSGLFGMMAGAFLLAPLADAIGRRPQILLCLTIIAVGMTASGFVGNLLQLMLLRFFTGVGIGGILASINTMVAEYSSQKWRNLSLSMMHIGYPLGVTLGGISAAFLMSHYGWRSVFILGGVLTALMILVVIFKLPESLDFLLDRQPPGALKRVNALLAKLKHQLIEQLPKRPEVSTKDQGIRLIMQAKYRLPSILLWLAFFMCMCSQYFLLNWLPQVLVDSGKQLQEGISAGVIMSVGGMIGMLCLGALTTRWNLVRVLQGYFIFAVCAMVAFGFAGGNWVGSMALVFGMGFFLYGAIIGLYMVGAWMYPSSIRTTGVGWAIGIGRFGAILGPYLAGLLIGAGIESATYFTLFAAPLLLAAISLLWIKIEHYRHGIELPVAAE